MKKIACLLVFLASSSAQPQPLEAGVRAVKQTEQLLRAGDQIEIHIFTLPDLEKNYRVRADGTIFHPFAGEVPVAGKTLSQLEVLLRRRFSKELREPGFRLSLSTRAEAEASVLGEVAKQGKLKFVPGASVLELLADCGGLSERADPDGALLLRGGKEIRLPMGPGSQAQLAQLRVETGDIIYVAKGRRIGVSGEVQNKGVYSIGSQSKTPVADAVRLAGGLTDTAALERVQVVRATEPNPLIVNLLDPVQSAQFQLQEGDVIQVPSRRVVVLGAVTKQGALPIPTNANLVEVISLAGVSNGRLDEVVVIRAKTVQSSLVAGSQPAEPEKAEVPKETYNLEQALKENGTAPAIPIHDGDLVYIAPKEANSGGMLNSGLLNLLVMARSLFAF